MTIEKTIAKVEKSTGLKIQKNAVGQYWIEGQSEKLSFSTNGDEAILFHVVGKNEKDDQATDYFPGMFYKNISQAIYSFVVAEDRVKKVKLLFSLGMSVAKISEQTGYTELAVLRFTQQF
jgi:hypothetical protein